MAFIAATTTTVVVTLTLLLLRLFNWRINNNRSLSHNFRNNNNLSRLILAAVPAACPRAAWLFFNLRLFRWRRWGRGLNHRI